MYYCECKRKVKRGRPGNEATITSQVFHEGGGGEGEVIDERKGRGEDGSSKELIIMHKKE